MKLDVLRNRFTASLAPKLKLKSVVSQIWTRQIQYDSRHRHSNFWIPPLSIVKTKDQPADSNELLVRAGFLRQAYSGVYHMLPLGLRIQNKLEALIDKHMNSIGASKLSLSSISAQELWQRSGRLSSGSELFKFQDRKGVRYLLSPTHEEEITSLICGVITSYRDLPVRVYQTSRKYRDEKRPRGGLLRGREFIMKDLYTFDETDQKARSTYDAVRGAYTNFFNELKVEYLEARADSGNMGGTLSHEYHLPSPKGEDSILSCSSCSFARNEELVDVVHYNRQPLDPDAVQDGSKEGCSGAPLFEFIATTRDRAALVKAYSNGPTFGSAPQADENREVNPHAVKAALDGVVELDMGVEDPLMSFMILQDSDLLAPGDAKFEESRPSVYYLFDDTVGEGQRDTQIARDSDFLRKSKTITVVITSSPDSPNPFYLSKRQTGDTCPQCADGRLTVRTAIEVGHAFHLGTRYSAKLGAKVTRASETEPVPLEMGCYGIGVSRLIAATASCLADEKGLNWPRLIAPFQVAILPRTMEDPALVQGALDIYDEITMSKTGHLSIDAIIDDRQDTPLPWKLNDADLIGYPVIIILGRRWVENKVEVQCRRLKIRTTMDIADAMQYVEHLLREL